MAAHFLMYGCNKGAMCGEETWFPQDNESTSSQISTSSLDQSPDLLIMAYVYKWSILKYFLRLVLMGYHVLLGSRGENEM